MRTNPREEVEATGAGSRCCCSACRSISSRALSRSATWRASSSWASPRGQAGSPALALRPAPAPAPSRCFTPPAPHCRLLAPPTPRCKSPCLPVPGPIPRAGGLRTASLAVTSRRRRRCYLRPRARLPLGSAIYIRSHRRPARGPPTRAGVSPLMRSESRGGPSILLNARGVLSHFRLFFTTPYPLLDLGSGLKTTTKQHADARD